MRFNIEAYERLYPRPKTVKEVETAVEGFTPSVKEDQNEKVVETAAAVGTESEVTDGGDAGDNPSH